MPKPGRPTRQEKPAKEAELVARRAEVSKLRRQGMTWHTIADRCGVGVATVRRDFEAFIESLDPPLDRENRRDDMREMLEQSLQQARMDAMSARAPVAKADGSQVVAVGALELADKLERRALSIMDQLRKLDGLDVPAKVDVTSGGEVLGSQTVLDRLAALLEVTDG